MGNIVAVAPYSGDMLAIVARVSTGMAESAGPQHSTSFPTRCNPTTEERAWRPVDRACLLQPRCPHAPSEHTESVHHRGVRVGADEGIPVGEAVAVEDHPGEVLEVYLVTDPRVRRHDGDIVEGLLRPAQELVALEVPGRLELGVQCERIGTTGHLGDDRMVDGDPRIGPGRIAAEDGEHLTHRGKSTTTGTPVKSCMRTRSEEKASSLAPGEPGPQAARAATPVAVTALPSSLRARFSNSTLIECGKREMSRLRARVSSRKIS